MTRVIYECESGVPWVQTSGSWTNVADTPASNGHYLTASAAAVLTLTVPSGNDCVLLNASRINRTGIASVTVDGVLQPDLWSLDDFTTATATGGATYTVQTIAVPVAMHRSLYRPIYISSLTSHTIAVAWVAGTIAIDCAEVYAATFVPTAGLVATIGHSFSNGTGLGSPSTQRATALLAGMIGGSESNHGFGSSNLMYDNNNTGFLPAPIGWLEALGDAGEVGGAISSVTITDGGQYTTGPTISNFTAPGGSGGTTATGTPILTGVSPNIAVSGITFINRGSRYLANATLSFNGSGARGAAAIGVIGGVWQGSLANGAYWWGLTPQIAVLWHGFNDANLMLSGIDPGGGVGYSVIYYNQRLLETIWRMNANSPNTVILLVGYTWNGPPSGLADHGVVSQALLLHETFMLTKNNKNLIFVDTYDLVRTDPRQIALLQSDGIHPNAAGHALIATALYRAYKQASNRPSTH